MRPERSVLVAGVGPGLGAAVSRRFAAEGYGVVMIARDASKLEELRQADPARLAAFAADLTDPTQIEAALDEAEQRFGPLACAVFNAGVFLPGSILTIDPATFEAAWRIGAFAGFLVGQAAAKRMVARAAGTILFTGATASRRGGNGFANLAAPKFALRAVAQSMARELGPKGIHVAHVIIDGRIRSDRSGVEAAEADMTLDAEAIGKTYWQIHRQHRSAWTHEVDLRPWVERF